MKTRKKIKKKKRPVNKDTKTYKAKEVKRLAKKALELWALVVKKRAGNVCEIGKFYNLPCSQGFLNAHHIEDKRNKALRLIPEDGVASCPGHHKFWDDSCHRSFLTLYAYLKFERPNDIFYLLDHYHDKVEITKEYLEAKIRESNLELYGQATGQSV